MASAFALREPKRSSTYLIKKADFTKQTARTGAVPLIQWFGSALNLNVHFHTLAIDGVFVREPDGPLRFASAKAPTDAEVEALLGVVPVVPMG